MRGYPQEFRNQLVAKALLPGGKSVGKLAAEHGITYQTLRQWIKQTGREQQGLAEKCSSELSLLEKKNLLFESKGLGGEKLGEFLRAVSYTHLTLPTKA